LIWTGGHLPSAPPILPVTEEITAMYSGYINLGFLFGDKYKILVGFSEVEVWENML
jgi:hypothetical protein